MTTEESARGGWRVVVGAGVVAAFGVQTLWGGTIGLFLRPMQAELGWSRSAIGFVTALTAAAAFVVVPAFGWLIDRVALRPLVIVGCIVQAACIAAGAWLAGPVWTFYAQVCLLMVFGTAASLLVLSKIVRGWFEASLGQAMGALFAIASAGGIVNPLLAQSLMARFGWRGAYFALGAFSLVVTTLAALVLVRESGAGWTTAVALHRAAAPALASLLRHRAWWVLLGWNVLFGYAASGIAFHLAALLEDRGATPAQSALAISLGAAGGLAGNLAAGWVTDRFSARLMASLVMLVPACGVLALLGATTPATGVAAAVVLGLSAGTEHSVVAVLCGRYFDAALYGRAYSSQMVAASAGSGVAPSLVGLLQERTGSYTAALAIAAATFALAAAAAWLLPARTAPAFAPGPLQA